MFVLKVGLES